MSSQAFSTHKMNKKCEACGSEFQEGTEDFEHIRLMGCCRACFDVDDEMSAKEKARMLHIRQVEDAYLKGLADAIQCGVDANVTSGPQQVSLIAIIRYGPCTVGEIANMIGLDQSSVTLHLKKFEHEELVKTWAGGDKRKKIVAATDKARALFRQ
jgi:DNA-binding MarR family transcriptional regulator